MDIALEENTCLYPQKALEWEWLDTNGRGGYASSTVMNCHTRKYHGLLVVALDKPAGRHVVLSKFEDSLCIEQEENFLSCHQYPGLFFPQKGRCLSAFVYDPAPQFTYHIDNLTIRKTVMILPDEDTVLVRYDWEGASLPSMLRLKPFLAFRGFHGLTKKTDLFDKKTANVMNGFSIRPYRNMPSLFIQTNVKSHFLSSPHWYLNFEYPAERERGYDWQEDLFHPGILEVPITTDEPVIVAASLKINTPKLQVKWQREETRRLRLKENDEIIVGGFPEEDRENIRQLLRAARQFIIRTGDDRTTVIAGYHWFDDWGRDTLISLPGLTFCSGHPDEGIGILESLGRHEKNGLLPNFFSPNGKDHAYNSVDASLWYFWAVQQMLKYTGNIKKIEKSIWPVMKRIVKSFMAGTVFGIHMSENGLLHAGNANTHLTWMDAVVSGIPVTPRWGFAVEINALWYNTLCFVQELIGAFGEEPLFPHELPGRIRTSFQKAFWIEEDGYLGDVLSQGVLDAAVRPNQIFALSLPFSPLAPSQAAGVLKIVEEHLLTPCGLRTLSPKDKAYRGKYEGAVEKRDAAYHQGTVWPWLLAPFGEAYLKIKEDKKSARIFILGHLRSFLKQHLWVAGLGTVSEIFDGDPPHTPRGCISQAWSVGGLLRLYSLLQETGQEKGSPLQAVA